MSNLPQENYAVLLVNTKELTNEQWLDLRNGKGTVYCSLFNPENLYYSDELVQAFEANENLLKELQEDK